MPSKFDLLRSGQSVEVEPGVSGRLNPKNKTLQLSTGEVLNVANDPDYFPRDDKALKVSRQKESIEKGIKGSPGEFLHQYTSQGIPGSIGDIAAYLTQTGEEYATRKQAQNEVSNRISKESPYISGAATGANIATDFALTRGMSALKAAPLLTAGSAGSRLFTEPGEVLTETAGSAALGYGLDKVGGYLNRVAQRRAESRAIPGQQQAVREANELGQQNVSNLNKLQQDQYNLLKRDVRNYNENRLRQHQSDLIARENQMIQSKNAYEQSKAAREAEIVKLKNDYEIAKAQRSSEASRLEGEYKAAKMASEQQNKKLQDEFKLAQSQYQESVNQLPELQRQAQKEFSENVVRNSKEIERIFPKSSKFSTDELGVANFIEENINKSGIAGSREGNQARRFLQSVFPEGEFLGGRELSKRYQALEEAIQKSSPEVQSILNGFKNHLGEKFPAILENSIVYHKIMPILKRTLENDVKAVINEINFAGKGSDIAKKQIEKYAHQSANTFLKHNDIASHNFIERIQNGELARDIANKIMDVEAFLIDISPDSINNLKRQGTFKYVVEDAQRKHSYFVNELAKKLENRFARYEIKAIESANSASKKLGNEIKTTYGMAEPITPPIPPQPSSNVSLPNAPGELPQVSPINIPPPIAPPQTPALPVKPTLLSEPIAPTPQTFVRQAEPMLAPASGTAERMGDFFEKKLMGGKGLIDNPLTKLAGLKYLLGSAALPAEAAYVGMNALTSPGSAGQVARLTFKQAGIRAIESWAQKYPSYHDGILENPQERRSLTKEIENASDIPVEQKAVIQSKINRGKPIQDRL